RVRILLGVIVVDAIHLILGHEHYIRLNFSRPQGCRRIGRHVRVTRASSEYDDPALLKVPDRPQSYERFRNSRHGYGCLDPGIGAYRFEYFLENQAIHNRGQHTNVIRRCFIHSPGTALDAAEDVTSTDDNSHLDSKAMSRIDFLGDAIDYLRL